MAYTNKTFTYLLKRAESGLSQTIQHWCAISVVQEMKFSMPEEVNAPVSKEHLRQLRYLVERLVVAISVYGYEDIEERSRHELQFGEIGAEGGGAPLSLNGRDVPYTFRLTQDAAGNQTEELVIEGKIYNRQNSNISIARKE